MTRSTRSPAMPVTSPAPHAVRAGHRSRTAPATEGWCPRGRGPPPWSTVSVGGPVRAQVPASAPSPPPQGETPRPVRGRHMAPRVPPPPSEDDDAAQDVAALHPRERLLDALDADRLGDEGVQVEAAAAVEVDEDREVAAGQAVAVPGRGQAAAAAEDLGERELHGHRRVRDADEDEPAGEVA